jgi:hypothetical protein
LNKPCTLILFKFDLHVKCSLYFVVQVVRLLKEAYERVKKLLKMVSSSTS